jgi:hypothetical protein
MPEFIVAERIPPPDSEMPKRFDESVNPSLELHFSRFAEIALSSFLNTSSDFIIHAPPQKDPRIKISEICRMINVHQ